MISKVFLFDQLRDILAPGIKSNGYATGYKLWLTKPGFIRICYSGSRDDRVHGVILDLDLELLAKASKELYGIHSGSISSLGCCPYDTAVYVDNAKLDGNSIRYAFAIADYSALLNVNDYSELGIVYNQISAAEATL